MQISLFSVLMTIFWSSLLILVFLFFRKKVSLLHICSIQTVILLYLFCAVRMALPMELPWTKEVAGGDFYRKICNVFYYETGCGQLYEILLILWIIGSACSLIRYYLQYRRAAVCLREMPQTKDETGRDMLEKLEVGGSVGVYRSGRVRSPCCIGILKKKILLPEKEYNDKELRYILLHEYTHLKHNDILLKVLISVLCGIYWWNPILYRMKKDLNQSMEIRCDLSVTGCLKDAERADYLSVILSAFRESRDAASFVGAAGLAEEHSESLLERFRVVADRKIVQEKKAGVLAGAVLLLVLIVSYSFIIQPKYEAPVSEIETDENSYKVDEENSYIIKRGDTYILHTVDAEMVISEEVANRMLKNRIELKEVSE